MRRKDQTTNPLKPADNCADLLNGPSRKQDRIYSSTLRENNRGADSSGPGTNDFCLIKDSGSVAQVNETRARVFLAQKRFSGAESVIFASITTLEQGDDSSLLAEALTTQGRIFAGTGKYSDARKAFN